jgi:integrase
MGNPKSDSPVRRVPLDEAATLLPLAPSAAQLLRPEQTGAGSAWSAKTVGEIADQLVAARSAGGANWSGAAPLGAMLKLMKHVMGGDRPFSELRQEHLGNFRDLMGQLPTRWGRTREEQLHGIPAALSRASTLEPDAVGLTGATIVKHLHYLEKLLEFAHARGAKPAEPLNLNTLKKEAQTQKAADHDENGRGRDNWEPEELAVLLNTPAFVGSEGGGRKERHKPGQLHFHDCDYWMLLLLIHTGARSSELAGLRLDEVLDSEPIPLIVFKNNPNRRIKTKAGRRRIPVHGELIRLNFFGYVHAMRAAGHIDLFPELKPGANQSWASVYMKHFTYLRKAAFPNGAKGAAQLKGAEKQKDVHGIRGTFITAVGSLDIPIVQQLVGHSPDKKSKVTVDYFSKELHSKMLKLMIQTTPFTESMQPLPVNLNPIALSPKTVGRPSAQKARRGASPTSLRRAKALPRK